MEKYKTIRTPPEDARKKILGGRLKGMTDINPQWRIDAMNDCFGLCGIGWCWDLRRVWREEACSGKVFAFAEVAVKIKIEKEWSEWVPGVGGSMLISQESAGLHSNDEGYKMAITDAIGTALKFFGVGAEIYRGHSNSKYSYNTETNNTKLVPKDKKSFQEKIDIMVDIWTACAQRVALPPSISLDALRKFCGTFLGIGDLISLDMLKDDDMKKLGVYFKDENKIEAWMKKNYLQGE